MRHHDSQTVRAAKLLAAAADRIEQCGLFQGEYWPINAGGPTNYIHGDPCCALGALAVAADVDDAPRADTALETRPELILAIDALTEHLDWPSEREPAEVPAWNDRPGRTRIEVTSALRAAAQRLRAQPEPPDPPASRSGDSSVTPLHRVNVASTHQQPNREVITNV